MTEPANSGDKGLRILLEALTTISYLKGQEGRAASIAEYALDHYENTLRWIGHSEEEAELPYLPGFSPEQRNHDALRRGRDRRYINCGPPRGQIERRLVADRRMRLDRRSLQPTYS